jgi:hypothetical protein
MLDVSISSPERIAKKFIIKEASTGKCYVFKKRDDRHWDAFDKDDSAVAYDFTARIIYDNIVRWKSWLEYQPASDRFDKHKENLLADAQ